MLNNKNFYPTPSHLLHKMFNKVTEFQNIKNRQKRFLDPSGGKGDIIEHVEKVYNDTYSNHRDVYTAAIEIDPDLQATLRGKNIRLLDSDFLKYSEPDQFDLIVMNPPFDAGEHHLMKAIDIIYRGEIVCLLNAETIRNAHSKARQDLIKRLVTLGANLDYIDGGFLDAERTTRVECALIYINIEREVEDDLFSDMNDRVQKVVVEKTADRQEISTKKTVEEMVLQYDRTIKVCTKTIMEFCRTRQDTRGYLTLSFGQRDDSERCSDLTSVVQHQINGVLKDIRLNYWRKVLEMKEVKTRLTTKKREEFEYLITTQCEMAFTVDNLRQFIINLIGNYEDVLTDAVVDIFDRMSRKHSWDESIHCKNVHYFDGWKTNDAFKVGKRVIIPVYASYGSAFEGYSGWQLDYKVAQELHDIDLVMNYFDARSDYESLDDSIKQFFAIGSNKGESTYFKFICYKKGTIHLTFKDEGILRRFNVTACKGKNWLPQDYGAKPLDQLGIEEQTVVTHFEDKLSDYVHNEGKPMFAVKEALQIGLDI